MSKIIKPFLVAVITLFASFALNCSARPDFQKTENKIDRATEKTDRAIAGLESKPDKTSTDQETVTELKSVKDDLASIKADVVKMQTSYDVVVKDRDEYKSKYLAVEFWIWSLIILAILLGLLVLMFYGLKLYAKYFNGGALPGMAVGLLSKIPFAIPGLSSIPTLPPKL